MIKTKSIHEPKEEQDGTRLFIAISRPRWYGKINYDKWMKELAPSPDLLNSYKNATKPDKHTKPHKTDCDCLKCQKAWDDYEPKFRHEMQAREESQTAIHDLAQRVKSGETITLICWCKVTDKVQHCHRIIVKELIESIIK